MFKKKKTEQPSAVSKKAGPFKRMERRFYSIFNNESGKRHKRLIFAFLLPVALGASYGMQRDPSQDRAADGAERVQTYTQEIAQLAQDSKAFAITPDGHMARGDAKALLDLDKRINALADQLILDTHISEQDAQDLTREFLKAMDDPFVGPQLQEALENIINDAAFLEDARKALVTVDPDDKSFNKHVAALKAFDIVSKADSKNDLHQTYNFIMLLGWMLMLWGDPLLSVLQSGRRRHETLQQQEKIETHSERLAQLRAMLAPKGQEPQQPKTPEPVPATQLNKASKRTQSRGPQ